MKYANFIAHGAKNNNYFSLDSRDNCNYPLWLLREKLKNIGIELNTDDVNLGREVDFEIHTHLNNRSARICYLFLWETTEINPENNKKALYKNYKKIFSWNDDLVKEKGFIKFFLPLPKYEKINWIAGWSNRRKFCCLIASNKVSRKKSSNELYTDRVKVIRWFEKYASNEFDLYGMGWNAFPKAIWQGGGLFQIILGNILDKLCSLFLSNRAKAKFFPSYKGPVLNKIDTLRDYKFSICYENVRELPGYITEKIFDCFMAGVIPIYWGASNINSYIPEDTFINRSRFKSNEDMYSFLRAMSEEEYICYQRRIKAFLSSQSAQCFNANYFVNNFIENM